MGKDWTAADVIADGMGDILDEWRASGEATTSAADRLLAFVLRHKLLFEAIREIQEPLDQGSNGIRKGAQLVKGDPKIT